jgi:hypothetical protein
VTPETLRALDQYAFVILPALLVAEQFGPMCDFLHRGIVPPLPQRGATISTVAGSVPGTVTAVSGERSSPWSLDGR